ncbi:MAG: GntR family transcriptional regulator [Caulobacteraceae bacterium]|nr:GntR family transcriptional regulator [Caulobacteraceae bacterium]
MARNRDPFATALRTLRDRAIAGAFSPGKPIIILDEAQALGLSTTPIREALAWLGGEGLIDRAPAGGYAGLRLDAAGLVGRYRLRLHCLDRGLRCSAGWPLAETATTATDTTQLFRHVVAGAADSTLIATYDRVQATIERFSAAEVRILRDMPDSLENVALLLSHGDVQKAAEAIHAFHARRISAAPLLTEAEQAPAGMG